jgi:hypothetical protein
MPATAHALSLVGAGELEQLRLEVSRLRVQSEEQQAGMQAEARRLREEVGEYRRQLGAMREANEGLGRERCGAWG